MWRKCPCSKDCARRTQDCHTSCPEYMKYEQEKNADYENKAKIVKTKGVYQVMNINKVLRRRIAIRTGK